MIIEYTEIRGFRGHPRDFCYMSMYQYFNNFHEWSPWFWNCFLQCLCCIICITISKVQKLSHIIMFYINFALFWLDRLANNYFLLCGSDQICKIIKQMYLHWHVCILMIEKKTDLNWWERNGSIINSGYLWFKINFMKYLNVPFYFISYDCLNIKF